MYGQCIKIGQCCDVYMHPLAAIQFKMLLLLCKSAVACVLMERILFVLSFTCLIKLVTESHKRMSEKIAFCMGTWNCLLVLICDPWRDSTQWCESVVQTGGRNNSKFCLETEIQNYGLFVRHRKKKKKKAAFRFTCSVFNLAILNRFINNGF